MKTENIPGHYLDVWGIAVCIHKGTSLEGIQWHQNARYDQVMKAILFYMCRLGALHIRKGQNYLVMPTILILQVCPVYIKTTQGILAPISLPKEIMGKMLGAAAILKSEMVPASGPAPYILTAD